MGAQHNMPSQHAHLFNLLAVCRAEELFSNSAFWKAETPTGYVEADVFGACEVFPNEDNGCCAMHFVPVVDGSYQATDDRCADAPAVEVVVSGQSDLTLEQSTDSEWSKPALQDENGNDAS
jgi:hypothetical protein